MSLREEFARKCGGYVDNRRTCQGQGIPEGPVKRLQVRCQDLFKVIRPKSRTEGPKTMTSHGSLKSSGEEVKHYSTEHLSSVSGRVASD